MSLITLNKRDAGIHELRSLIQRHPQTPEAAQARAKLNGMGVRINASYGALRAIPFDFPPFSPHWRPIRSGSFRDGKLKSAQKEKPRKLAGLCDMR